jgi:hypothetical protein
MTTVVNRRAKARRKQATVPPAAPVEMHTASKARFALDAARAGKLLDGDKTHLLSARLNEGLVAAAKERTGITSDTQLVELALASLAVGDDFGEWLVTQGGRLKADFEIDL